MLIRIDLYKDLNFNFRELKYLSIFVFIPDINLNSKVYVLVIKVKQSAPEKRTINEIIKDRRTRNEKTDKLTSDVDISTGGLFEIYRATHIFRNSSNIKFLKIEFLKQFFSEEVIFCLNL